MKTGKVLLAGGDSSEHADSDGYVIYAALYDPATGTWALTGAMGKRFGHTATLLPTGKVLVMGGVGPLEGGVVAYDPTTGTWESLGGMALHRVEQHTATVLPTGKVLVLGGISNHPEAIAELYDPATKSGSPAMDISSWRYGHTVTVLPSGQVLVVGNSYGSSDPALLYNP